MITLNRGQVLLSFKNAEEIKEFAYYLLEEALKLELKKKYKNM